MLFQFIMRGDQFKRFFSSYALAFNRMFHRNGSLFQKRFKRIQIRNDVHLLRILVYIHHNPIHHAKTQDYSFWDLSSYNSYFFDSETIVETSYVIGLIDENEQKSLQQLYNLHEQNLRFSKL